MEFRDLKRQYRVLKEQIDEAVISTIECGSYVMGEPVIQLEHELASYVGVKYCISCANGTDALTLALMAWEIGAGDAVFVPDFTFFASGEVVSYEGATPVFVDVDKDTFNISPSELEDAIIKVLTEGKLTPKVVIAVDLFGLPADYEAIKIIVDRYNLKLLEDGAQGFGGRIGNRKACSFGDISTTSFFPAKPLGGYGDGGAVFTDDDTVAEYLKSIRVHGKGKHKYDNIRIGVNSRLDTIQAAVLRQKLTAFIDFELESVNKVYLWYSEELKTNSLIKSPVIPNGFYSSFAQYTILVKDKVTREALCEFLKKQQIPTMVYYQKPMHLQEAFAYLTFEEGEFAVTEELCERVLSLPMHPYMERCEVKKVCLNINDFFISYTDTSFTNILRT